MGRAWDNSANHRRLLSGVSETDKRQPTVFFLLNRNGSAKPGLEGSHLVTTLRAWVCSGDCSCLVKARSDAASSSGSICKEKMQGNKQRVGTHASHDCSKPRTAQLKTMTTKKVNGKMLQTFRHLLQYNRGPAAEHNCLAFHPNGWCDTPSRALFQDCCHGCPQARTIDALRTLQHFFAANVRLKSPSIKLLNAASLQLRTTVTTPLP